MKLLTLVMFLSCATAAAAESPPTGKSVSAAGIAFRPRPEDYYPAASGNLQEQGMPKLKLCYDDQGRPVQVNLDTTSNFKRLDEAAVRYGKAVRIRPGLIDGQPQPGCLTLSVLFSPKKSLVPPDQGESMVPPVDVPPVLDSIPLPPHYPGRFIPLGGETR